MSICVDEGILLLRENNGVLLQLQLLTLVLRRLKFETVVEIDLDMKMETVVPISAPTDMDDNTVVEIGLGVGAKQS